MKRTNLPRENYLSNTEYRKKVQQPTIMNNKFVINENESNHSKQFSLYEPKY